MTGILIFVVGMIAGAVIVPVFPPLFRLAARIRAWIGDNIRLPQS